MPIYKCPKCGRIIEAPKGTYYCRICGPEAIMSEVKKTEEIAPICEQLVTAFVEMNLQLARLEEKGLITHNDRTTFINQALRLIYKAGCGYRIEEIWRR